MNRNEGSYMLQGILMAWTWATFSFSKRWRFSRWPGVDVAIIVYLHCHRNSFNYHHLGSYFWHALAKWTLASFLYEQDSDIFMPEGTWRSAVFVEHLRDTWSSILSKEYTSEVRMMTLVEVLWRGLWDSQKILEKFRSLSSCRRLCKYKYYMRKKKKKKIFKKT